MINFQKQIFDEIKKRGMTINQAALSAGMAPPILYSFRDGRPIESKSLEKILNSFGAELIFTTKPAKKK